MSSQRISLIIPTYNRAAWIGEALRSVFEQTRVPDEIIVVADGATDTTLDVLAHYAGQLTIIEQAHSGRSAARNAGLKAATGDLIAFLDDDDRLPPDSIRARASFLEQHREFDVVYGEAQAIDAQGAVLGRLTRLNPARPSGFVFGEVAYKNLAPIHAIMFRRTCFEQCGGFDEQLDTAEDWDLWIRFAARHLFGHIHDDVADYRFHAAMSSSRDCGQLARNTLRVQKRTLDLPEFEHLSSHRRAGLYARYAIQSLHVGELEESRRAYVRALRTDPLYWPSYPLLIAVTLFGRPIRRLLRSKTVRTLLPARQPYRPATR